MELYWCFKLESAIPRGFSGIMNRVYKMLVTCLFSLPLEVMAKEADSKVLLVNEEQLENKDYLEAVLKRFLKTKAELEDPKNWEDNGKFVTAEEPKTMMIDLAILESAGRIEKRKVFIPEVPNQKEYILMWMSIKSTKVLHIESIGAYQKGEIPLFFEIGYEPSFEKELDKFVERVKLKHKEKLEGIK